MHIAQIQENLELALERSLKNISLNTPPKEPIDFFKIELEIPKDCKHGDLTTNIAMRMARNFGLTSVKLANLLKDELGNIFLNTELKSIISRIEVAPPGFINFWFDKKYLYAILSSIQRRKKGFGRNRLGKGKRVNIEFVSANPTGPLTVAHGRQAAVGDALGRILEFSGYKVTREYFINDVGVQIDLLGESIYARYLTLNNVDAEFPKDGYYGEYITKIATEFNKKYGEKFVGKKDKASLQFIAQLGINSILNTIKKDLKKFGISFDKWFSQKNLSQKKVISVLHKIKNRGYIYEKDGATWFKSTAFGDDKDRVVIKKDGAFTYLAPDIAYHLDKYSRRFSKLIDIWGPDHHGYIPRLRAAIASLGYKPNSISILIVQLATLFRDGVALSMSTRKGEFITLRRVIEEVSCDVTKFFFLMRKLDSHLDFDLEIAKKDSLDNPVYYIQYAHARIASIFDFSTKLKNSLKTIKSNLNLLDQPEELLLLRMLCQFPVIVEASAKTLEPYRLVEYLNELAKVFHNFYTKHRVVSDKDLALTKARLSLVEGIKIVLANGLRLLGISLPERM